MDVNKIKDADSLKIMHSSNQNTSHNNIETIINLINHGKTEEMNLIIRNPLKTGYSESSLDNFTLYKPQQPYNFFKEIDGYRGTYGVDQGIIKNICNFILEDGDGDDTNNLKYGYVTAKKMKNKDTPEISFELYDKSGRFTYLKNKIMNQYGFSEEDAEIALFLIDDAGACTYATLCNEIFHQFSNNPDAFEQFFGYPMYLQDVVIPGTRFNAEELMVDLYLFLNDKRNGGSLFENGKLNQELLSSTVDPLGRPLLNSGDNQVYCNWWGAVDLNSINRFLKSKCEYLQYSAQPNIIWNNSEPAVVKEWIDNKIIGGSSISLSYWYIPNSENFKTVIHMKSFDESLYPSCDTTSWGEGAAHSVFVTGTTEEGLIVSSWGNKYLIPFEDLNYGVNCNINVSDINFYKFDFNKIISNLP